MVVERRSKMVAKEALAEDYNDVYWEMRYGLRAAAAVPPPISGSAAVAAAAGGAEDAVVPRMLLKWKERILLAGKYWNVLRECGKEIEQPKRLDADLNIYESKLYFSYMLGRSMY
jgi:gamma-tubulin complex component 2